MILSFQQRFVPSVQDGTKPHSLRAGQRWRVGMPIQFYENARQSSMRKFRPDAVATVVQAVVVKRVWPLLGGPVPSIVIDGRELRPLECETLAHSDGFDSASDLVRFLEQAHGLPFTGQLVGWTDIRY